MLDCGFLVSNVEIDNLGQTIPSPFDCRYNKAAILILNSEILLRSSFGFVQW